MAFSRPLITRLISRARGDIESVLQNGAVFIRRSFENASAKAQAGLAHSLHGHLFYISEQIIIDTADDEFLVRWANIFLGEDSRKDAIRSEFTTLATAPAAGAGKTIPIGTRFTRPDGELFETEEEFTIPLIASFEVSVTVFAVTAGQNGNTIPGSILTFESPIADINAETTVEGAGSDPIGGGADIESIDALRTRLLEFIQTPPKGGALTDYETWAKATPDVSVTRAFELPLQLGPGTVLLLFVQDTFDADGNFIDTIFPGAGDVTDVDDYVEAQKPITAILTTQAPIETTLDPDIQLLPNTPEVQAEVDRQLQDLLLRESTPNTTLALSKINEAISIAVGEEDHVLVSPVVDVDIAATELLTLGTSVYSAIP